MIFFISFLNLLSSSSVWWQCYWHRALQGTAPRAINANESVFFSLTMARSLFVYHWIKVNIEWYYYIYCILDDLFLLFINTIYTSNPLIWTCNNSKVNICRLWPVHVVVLRYSSWKLEWHAKIRSMNLLLSYHQ